MVKRKKQQEGVLQRACLKYLREHVGGVWFNISPSTYQASGDPDIMGCYEGMFYAFETKDGYYKATVQQQTKLERIRLSGGVAMEIRSLNELKNVFKI